jgi:hypothetical protein
MKTYCNSKPLNQYITTTPVPTHLILLNLLAEKRAQTYLLRIFPPFKDNFKARNSLNKNSYPNEQLHLYLENLFFYFVNIIAVRSAVMIASEANDSDLKLAKLPTLTFLALFATIVL